MDKEWEEASARWKARHDQEVIDRYNSRQQVAIRAMQPLVILRGSEGTKVGIVRELSDESYNEARDQFPHWIDCWTVNGDPARIEAFQEGDRSVNLTGTVVRCRFDHEARIFTFDHPTPTR